MTATVRDNPAEKRYEVHVDGELAGFATYHLSGPRITLIHTEVDDAYEGQGIGKLLAEYVLDAARDAGPGRDPEVPVHGEVHPGDPGVRRPRARGPAGRVRARASSEDVLGGERVLDVRRRSCTGSVVGA